jgi:hypothetical protein
VLISIEPQDIQRLGGGGLLAKYQGSPLLLLSTVYPDCEWLPWRFERVPVHFWEDISNQRKFLDWAAQELGIKDFTKWYSVTLEVRHPVIFVTAT